MPAVYNVMTTADVVDVNDGLLSLREAMTAANASVGVADTINLPAGAYTLTLTGANEEAAATGDLDVKDGLTIQGAGAGSTFVDGNHTDRVFDVTVQNVSLSLSGLTVRNGRVTGDADHAQGGGIRAGGPLTLTDCIVVGNVAQTDDITNPSGFVQADGARGGGIHHSGRLLALTRTTVSNNQAIGGDASGQTAFGGGAQGGGIFQFSGTVTITDSSITDNTAQGGKTTSNTGVVNGGSAGGGGIYQLSGLIGNLEVGSLALVATIIGNNRAVGGASTGLAGGQAGQIEGGGLSLKVPATLTDSALVNNQAIASSFVMAPGGSSDGTGGLSFGGGVWTSEALSVTNTTVSGNRAQGGPGGGGAEGGGAYTLGPVFITSSTFTQNTAVGGSGGGVYSSWADLVIRSTIVAANSAQNGPDISRATGSVPVISLGNNLIGRGAGAAGLVNGASGDQVGGTIAIDPRLGPLTSNGGRTPTHALLTGSSAIDRGAEAPGVANDQRGSTFPRSFGPPDVGAFELTVPGIPTATAHLPAVNTPGGASYRFDVTFSDEVAIATASIATGAITVTGPNGFSVTPALISLDGATDAPVRTATFEFTAPGGTWDGADAGAYTVSVVGGRVTDTAGNPVPAGPLAALLPDFPATYCVTIINDAGPGSLRQAVIDSNLTAAADTVIFDAAVFATARTITLTSGMLNVHSPLTVSGPGAALLTVSGNNATRIFTLDGLGQIAVTISGMTLTAGRAAGSGAAVLNTSGGAVRNTDEVVTIDGCVFTGNNAPSGSGGAVYGGTRSLLVRGSSFTGNSAAGGGAIALSNGSSLTVEDSTITANSARKVTNGAGIGQGGGIFTAGSFRIVNSTIANNSANVGGAIYVNSLFSGLSGGTYALVNSTLSGNTAETDGGAFQAGRSNSFAVLLLQNVTVTGNSAANGVGGFAIPTSTPAKLVVTSSIIAGNTGTTAQDIASTGTVDLTYSAVGSVAGFTPSAASGNNLPFGSNLLLGPLADNGGPTRTHALSAGSPAINAGSNPANFNTDQRGAGFVRVSGATPDIGAFEVQTSPLAVTAVVVNAGAAQRSMVNQVTVTFAGLVTFIGQPAAAFRLARTGPGGPSADVALTVDLTGTTAAQTIAKLTFSGPLTEGPAAAPSLIDGNYTLTVLSGQVVGGLSGGDSLTILYRLYGDVNGDRAVNGLDLAVFRTAFGTSAGAPNYVAALDQNGDGAINGLDLAEFRTRFGTVLP